MKDRRMKAIVIALLVGMMAMASTAGAVVDPIDCAGPAPDAEPGTPEWDARDLSNMLCAEQRHLDQATHPAPILAMGPGSQAANDAYRDPAHHDGARFRYDVVTVAGLDAEVYRPCATDSCSDFLDTLTPYEPPYPVVVVLHGGLSRKELHWWSSQPLAEAGYFVVAFDATGVSPSDEDTIGVLDWLFAPDNPYADDLDLTRVGLAGHSAGGVVSSRLGQRDDRVDAIVSWDRAQSGQMPEDLELRHPALFLFADYNCQAVPVCQPERYETQPTPDGPGNKGEDFQRLSAAGVDTMQIALRAALHLDFVPSELSGNRYVELVTMYYTVAWFDRYLKGATDADVAADAFARLTAAVFDDTADRHNISQGLYDPTLAIAAADPYAGNVPYAIAGMPVSDRLSFYFLSKCYLTVPDTNARVNSDDMRAGGCAG